MGGDMDGEREPLTRDRILAAATDIIDREGGEGLTMVALGDALDVTGMAIYKHFPSKGALLDAVLDALLSALPDAPAEGSWQERIRALYIELWHLFRAHPRAWPLACTRPLDGPGPRAGRERAGAVLAGAGFDLAQSRRLVSALTAFALGYAGLVAGGFAAAESSLEAGPTPLDWDALERDYAAGLDALIAAHPPRSTPA